MILPSSDCYKDIHSGMRENFPGVTFQRLEDYLKQVDKKFDEKVKQLFEERYEN